VEAHLYAALMSHGISIQFPCLGVVLSGGHTAIVFMKDAVTFELIGQTVDDAIGEAFDKVSKMMGLPYPGGPPIEKIALTGNPNRFPFKAGHIKGRPLDFSFSGLKTAVLYTLNGKRGTLPLTAQDYPDIAASFQRAAFEDVIKKTVNAAEKLKIKTIVFGGGVTNNQALRKLFENESGEMYRLVWPSLGLSLDNAAMIAGLGYHRFLSKGEGDPIDLEPQIRIPFLDFKSVG